MQSKKHLITIVGATAIGKTELSIKLAKHFNTEIISCDSRQFYKEMTIGTAVPSSDELLSATHHFIQNRSIFDAYNVGEFEKDALEKLEELFQKNDIVIMVGGSGLYIDAVLKGLDYFPEINPEVREKLNQQLIESGLEYLQQQLKKLDFESYKAIELENPHRVIRALEICIGAEKPYSFYKNKPKKVRNFTPVNIGITAERETIYKRINQRVDAMINDGLLDEAKKIYVHKKLNALQTVGYREIFQFLDDEITLDFAISEIKKNTRRFAKRQNTWFKKNESIKWFDFEEDSKEIIKYVNSVL